MRSRKGTTVGSEPIFRVHLALLGPAFALATCPLDRADRGLPRPATGPRLPRPDT